MNKRSMWLPVAVLALTATLATAEATNGGPSGPAEPAMTWQAARSLLEVSFEVDAQGQPVTRLHTDGPVQYESFLVENPDRLVLDLTGVVNRSTGQQLDVGMSGLARVRTGQHATEPVPVTRVVFDLDRPLDYEIRQQGDDLQVVIGSAAPASQTTAAATKPTATTAENTPVALEQVLREMESRQLVDWPNADGSSAEAQSQDVHVAHQPAGEAAVTATPVASSAASSAPAVQPDVIDSLLSTPAFAAPDANSGSAYGTAPESFRTKRIVTDEVVYTGKRISLNLVDADIKQVFRLFHEISGLNFVLDPDVGGRVTIVLDQVPWDQALDIILKNNSLDKVLDNNVLRIASTTKLADEAAARRELREAQELEVEALTLTRTLSYAKAADVERVIQNGGILSPRGSVIVDERTNTLIISDVPKKVEPLDRLISTLDAETPQVMIEARIVETSRSLVRDLGVKWDVSAVADASRGTSTGLSFPHNASARYGLNLPRGGASTLGFKLGNIVDSFTLDVALNALETEGRGRILSSPKIATQNNERAEIEQGVRIPIVNTTATEINVEFVSASLRLNVTPQITAEGTIILDVEVENNSPDFVNTAGDIPSIRTQRAQTKVLITDGGTTVIGGIFTINEGESKVGVPWFRKVPVFGWLFRSENITNENRELLIFITPKIVKLS